MSEPKTNLTEMQRASVSMALMELVVRVAIATAIPGQNADELADVVEKEIMVATQLIAEIVGK